MASLTKVLVSVVGLSACVGNPPPIDGETSIEFGPRCILSEVISSHSYVDSSGNQWAMAVIRWPLPTRSRPDASPYPFFPQVIQCTTLLPEHIKGA